MNRRVLAQEIRSRAYLEGEFVLRSGVTTDRYFDKYRFESAPELLRAIADAMVPLVPADSEVPAGLELTETRAVTPISLR